jgi:hypothetical protein
MTERTFILYIPGSLVLRYSTNGEEGCKRWKEVILEVMNLILVLDVILVMNLILGNSDLLWGGRGECLSVDV